MKIVILLNSVGIYFLHIYCIYPIHINYMAIDSVYFMHGWMVKVHCCIILHRVNTLASRLNINVLVKSNYATLTPFGTVSCFVVGICLSYYNLSSFLIHQASYSNGCQKYLMHREILGSIWKIGRYPIKVSEVLYYVSIWYLICEHLSI